jgi:peptidoglycan/LPS O-acetylase OafA/YrhL
MTAATALPTTVASRKVDRVEFMDFVRSLAAFAVVFEHSLDKVFPPYFTISHNYFNLGKFGITIFFLVSGFVIPLSLERGHSLKRFWVHRFFRLFPLYWFSLAIVIGLYLLGVTSVIDNVFPDHLLKNGLINITMLQGVAGVPSAIGLYYTLTIELLFYFACSFLFLARRLEDSYKISWGLLILASSAWILGPLVLHRRMEMAGLFAGVTLFMGTTIYRLYQGKVSLRKFNVLLIALLLSTSVGIWLNYVYLHKSDPVQHFSFIAIFAAWFSAYALFLGAYALRKYQFPRIGLWFGRISYSVYLLHPIILLSLYRGRGGFLFVAGVMLLTIVVAQLSFKFIESPMIALGKRITGDRRR